MQNDVQNIIIEAEEAAQACHAISELVECKNAYVGKKWSLTALLKWVKDLSPEDRATVGKEMNDKKKSLLAFFDEQEARIKSEILEKQINDEFEDMTVPLQGESHGKHPMRAYLSDVSDIFQRMGFSVYTSPHMTTEYDNFDALNIPSWHPARDMQDTFWLKNGKVLATQTSCMQNKLLSEMEPPIRSIVIGCVYRNEKMDATHEIMFDQVEGICVDKDVSIAHLKYTIETYFTEFFKKDVAVRFRPGYFPFVEPGLEVDISCPFCAGSSGSCSVCKGSKWIEMGGSWLIHPNVLKEAGIDSSIYSGFAFWGFGRSVMIKYGINDLRHIHGNKIEFLSQF